MPAQLALSSDATLGRRSDATKRRPVRNAKRSRSWALLRFTLARRTLHHGNKKRNTFRTYKLKSLEKTSNALAKHVLGYISYAGCSL
jgi:hypothetical protein